MDAERMDNSGRAMTFAGTICGIMGTVGAILVILFLLVGGTSLPR
jgi:hypothetical protein